MTEVATQGILERAGVKVTPTSLTVTDPELPYETMEELAGFVGNLEASCPWWTADLLIAAESLYREEFAQLEAILGLAPSTITNRVSVAKRFPPGRRRQGLSFSIHAEVAYLDPAEQERWLDEAENGMTRSDLRRAIKGELPPAVTDTCPTCGQTIR